MFWAVLAATLLLLLPAFYNGFPLLFPDSLEYVSTGKAIWEGLQGRPSPFYGQRSELYSLLILPLHQEGRSLWPIIAAQAAITAYLMALCYRALLPWKPRRFVALVALLTGFTSLGWTVTWLLPDYTAAALIMAVFLVGPARCRLSRPEQIAVVLLLAMCIVSHGANLLLALGLCLLPRRKLPLLALALAIGLQCWIHGALYGRPSLFANPPPFLLARWVGDGLVIRYLNEDPGASRFALHPYRDRLKANSNHFLWEPESAYNHLKDHHPETWEQVKKQQLELCLTAAATYPAQQMHCLLHNGIVQLVSLDASYFRPAAFVERWIGDWIPAAARGFAASRQARKQLPLLAMTVVFYGGVMLAVAGLFRLRAFQPERWPELWRVVWTGLLLNAVITGCLSCPDSRYQVRAIWLIPWVAALKALQQEESGQEGNA